ncbi:MAG: S41 family peptidase [Oceanospirillaceae bacterium]|nr:S41 family peptidase [Oceanospirillaceae bacterium]
MRKFRPLMLSVALAATAVTPSLQAEESAQLPLEELRMFAEVFGRIKSSYVEPVSDRQLLEDAIRGMVAGLDPHSSYLVPEDFSSLQEHTSGRFGGLGIEVGMKDGMVHVISPIDDTPASRAGLQAGDLIIKIDDAPVQGMGLDEAVDLLRGEIGTSVRLSILRESKEAPFEVEIERAAIKSSSVKSRLLADGYGYVRISQFQANTGEELAEAIAKVSEKEPLKGLVLDLRNNPGGVLQAAVDVSDAFLNEGQIVYTEGRLDRSELSFDARTETQVDMSTPLIVLINGGSASASEIVAGALQDQKRAVIMGTQSFGKGSVQTILPLAGDRGVKITTARYFTPSGRSIQAQGIVPDVVVERRSLNDADTPAVELIRERDLAGHLENGDESKPVAEELNAEDFQLYQAYTLLKALSIVSSR